MKDRVQRTDKKYPTRHYSKNQEKYVSDRFGGRRTPNSGATMFQKGDVELDNFLIECKTKTSDSESISIKKDWLEKNDKEALFMGKKFSALAFSFGPEQQNYYIINEELFNILTEMVVE